MGDTKLGIGGQETIQAPDAATSETMLSEQHRASAPMVGRAQPEDGGVGRGDSIGRFVVLGVLGQGGMGVVYSAYDPHLDRKVALKLLRADSASTDAGTRLVREAQAMAKIDHPSVIRVHEVGMLGSQVYVAMEFADGGTLREWLRAGPHAIREIVEKFAQAGQGLAAAHGAGLVHRDFKPDNVLLAKDGTARVTDFGLVSVLADATAAPASPRAATEPPVGITSISGSTPLSQDLTRTGAIMGTPSYMAPEQFRGTVSTASTDQFAFAIALYEALYGQRPFEGTTYAALCESVLLGRILPAPKGTRVPSWIRRVLVRALALDPAHRYPAMSALLAALARDPVRRRNRVLVALGAAACVGGGVYAFVRHESHAGECTGSGDRVAAVWNPAIRATLGASFEATGRSFAAAEAGRTSDAIDGWASRWEAGYVGACEDTRVRGTQSEHMLDLRMQCLSRRLDHARATIEALTTGGTAAVDHAGDLVGGLPSLAPCADAEALVAAVPPPELAVTALQVDALRGRLATARGELRLAHYDVARRMASEAVVAARAIGYPPAIAEAMTVLGESEMSSTAPHAESVLREAMHRAAEVGDSVTLVQAASLLLAFLGKEVAKLDRADEIAALVEPIAAHARLPAEVALELQAAIALVERTEGKLAAAQARGERARAIAEKELGPDHIVTLRVVSELGDTLMDRGRYDEARKAFEHVVAVRERTLGSEHPSYAKALNNIARLDRRQAKYVEAKQVAEHTLAIMTRVFGPEHPEVANALNSLGAVYADLQDRDHAVECYRKALAILEKIYGPDSVQVMGELSNLGVEEQDDGDLATARQLFERALAICEKTYGHDSVQAVNFLTNIGVLEGNEHKYDEALATYRHAFEIAAKANGPDSPDAVDLLFNEAVVLKQQKKIDEAITLTERAIELAKKAYGPDHPRLAMAYFNLGNIEQQVDRDADALESYRKSLALFEAKFGKDHMYTSYSDLGIGDALTMLHRPKEAVPYLEHALAIRTKTKQPPRSIAEIHHALGDALVKIGDRPRAVSEIRQALALYQEAHDDDGVKRVHIWLKKYGF